jgi:dipeptidyl aminopeptidase/acylaminoacyl peptidase
MSRFALAFFVFALLAGAPAAAQEAAPATNPDEPSYILPPAPVQNILHTDKNFATLDYVSPDGDHFLVTKVNELSTLALMSKPTLRLAEMEIRPATNRLWHLDTWGVYGMRFYSLKNQRFVDVSLPEGSFASDFTWSPDGSAMAFLAHLPDHTEVWTADPATGRARSLSSAPVMATAGTSSNNQGHGPSHMLQWTPEGTLLTLLVPSNRGSEPAASRIPQGPLTRHTRAQPVGNPTYRFLLRDQHDEDLFEYYTTSQLAELAPGQRPVLLGEPKMYESISLSADGQYVMAVYMERPFSFLTSYRGFPRKTEVLDRKGDVVVTLASSALREGRSPGAGGGFGRGGDNGGNDPRSWVWRADGAGLAYLQRAPGARGAEGDAPRPDRLMLVPAPFDTAEATVVAESEDPIRSVSYSKDGRHAFATVTRGSQSGLVHWAVGGASPARDVVVDFHATDDPTELPGELLTQQTGNGLEYAVVSSDGASAYLEGDGYAADFRPTPFIDQVAVTGGAATRVFEGAKDSFDQPLVALDADLTSLVASREAVHRFPDSYLWTRDGGWGANLTNNVDPFPEVTAAERIDFEFTRRDGLEVQGRVSMPVGWKKGDAPVPAMFWDYPREYTEGQDYERAAIRGRNHNAFTQMSWLRWSDIWLTQGYALVYADIPIVGENYNDTYVASLVDGMYGAVRAVDELGLVDINRIGHGGHSYGAFATANILANAPFFKAGIAGDGAYNRSLTPDGFQAERRSIWEAPQTYLEMSPFFKADQIDTPLLMYHGADDNNTGTFPIQAERMISALTILGKTAVLYEYPYESHTPRAMENKLDMWARFLGWFDEYVKGAEAHTATEYGGGH